MTFDYERAICYSGYREGQDPRRALFPSYQEIREDLLILAKYWRLIRLYDCSRHAETVLKVISDEHLDMRLLLGVDMAAEVNNPHCPWGGEYSEEILHANRCSNDQEIDRLIALANEYPEIVVAVSVGNEATVEWNDHMVPVESLIRYVQRVRAAVQHPITFCENYVPWTNKLEPLAAELDFLSVHTYPVWEYQSIDNAIDYTARNYGAVAEHYPDKPVIITEAGWTTASNGRGIEPWNATEELQARYYDQLLEWSAREKIVTFVFEAFDEPWKGSADPLEPEKHWGLFNVDRTPKRVMRERYPELLSGADATNIG